MTNTPAMLAYAISDTLSPMAMSSGLRWLPRISAIGIRATAPWLLMASNAGDSLRLTRTKMPTPTSRMLTRNGTRHPHASSSASGSPTASANMPMAARLPSGLPICTMLPNSPRRPGGAFSTTISTAPPHSPPSPTPCRNRRNTSRSGAAMPIWLYVGNSPIKKVPMPMMTMVAESIAFRPSLSPKCPNTAAPTGRARNPIAYVANATMVLTEASPTGKNSRLNTSPVAVA